MQATIKELRNIIKSIVNEALQPGEDGYEDAAAQSSQAALDRTELRVFDKVENVARLFGYNVADLERDHEDGNMSWSFNVFGPGVSSKVVANRLSTILGAPNVLQSGIYDFHDQSINLNAKVYQERNNVRVVLIAYDPDIVGGWGY